MPETEKSEIRNDDKLERALGHKPPFNPPQPPKAETEKRTPKQAPLKKIRVTLQKIRVKNERKNVTYKINAELADQFTKRAQELGMTTCSIVEGIAAAFLKGTSFIISSDTQKHPRIINMQFPWVTFTMNVQVAREVLKARRYSREGMSERQVNPLLNFDVPCGETCSELIDDYY